MITDYTNKTALCTTDGELIISGGLAAFTGLPAPLDKITTHILELEGTTALVHDDTRELHLVYARIPDGKGAQISLPRTAPGVWESMGETILLGGRECMLAGRFEITDERARTFYFIAALYDRGGLV